MTKIKVLQPISPIFTGKWRYFLLTLVFCSPVKSLLSQDVSRWYLGFQSGLTYYVGDLKDNSLPNPNFLHPDVGLNISYAYQNIFAVTAGIHKSSLSGADSLGKANTSRNFHFRSTLEEIFITTRLNLLNYKGRLPITPGMVFGMGYFHFNPQGKYKGVWYDLQPLGTEGQYLEGHNNAPYSLWEFTWKFGPHFEYALGDKAEIGLFAIYNLTFTDYLDDVSTDYPDYDELVQNESGVLAAEFTYGGRDGAVHQKGEQRGNPKDNDGFVNIGFSLLFRLDHPQKKESRYRVNRKGTLIKCPKGGSFLECFDPNDW